MKACDMLRGGKDPLYELLFHSKFESPVSETLQFSGIIIPLIQMNQWSVYIYGYEQHVSTLITFMKQLDIQIEGIIDRNIEKTKIKRWDDIPVIHISQLDRIKNPKNVFVVIAINAVGMDILDITNVLTSAGIEHYCTIAPFERDYINGRGDDRSDYYRAHYSELKMVLDKLDDETSKNVMLEYLRCYLQYDTYCLPICEARYKYFFGHKDNQGKIEQLYIHRQNETWLNCGSSLGDTIFQYFANGLDADTVFAIEANSYTFSALCHNLDRLPDRYREKVKPVNIFLDQETDFQTVLSGKSVSLINADIEGGELDLLNSLSQIIKRDRPVLAICAYHKACDLIDFFNFMERTVPDYFYMLRKYPCTTLRRFASELVFYAIPSERRILGNN